MASVRNSKPVLCLAPLAGVTDMPMREFFSRLGAELTHTEMLSCAGLLRGNAKTIDMLQTSELEAPVVLQLFDSEADVLVAGGERALELKRASGQPPFAGLGINMGCPMPKVTKRGAGSALLNRPDVACAMVRGLKALGLPVWVKMRKLQVSNKANKASNATERQQEQVDATLSFIDKLASAGLVPGIDNICLHGRTAAQRYEGIADRTIVAAAASRFPGLISASGDVRKVTDIQEYLEMGCCAVMLARGALENPWLFPLAHHALKHEADGTVYQLPDSEIRLRELKRLGERAKTIFNEHQAVILLKRLMSGVLRGISGAAELRARAGRSTTLDEIMGVFCEGLCANGG